MNDISSLEKEKENQILTELLHDIAFFSIRTDARLHPEYEKGWNDAVSEMSKKALEYFKSKDIHTDSFIDENIRLRDACFSAIQLLEKALDEKN